jgi:ATP-dependent Lon protease
MNQDTSSDMRSAQPDTTDRHAADTTSQAQVTTRPLPSDALLIVPVRNAVLFPGLVLPLTVGSERARAAVQEAVRLEQPIGVLLQSKADVDEPGPDDLHWVGASAGVLRYVTTPEGVHHIIC